MAAHNRPNYWWSLFTMKCPRCRKGPMFVSKNPWNLRTTLKMPEKCPECGQPYKLEVGFWYGTGYVIYVLTVAFSIFSFIAWWLIIGISVNDDRFFAWIIVNAVLMILLQPWFMRLSRVIYLKFFVSYDPDYKNTQVRTFDYETGGYYDPQNPEIKK